MEPIQSRFGEEEATNSASDKEPEIVFGAASQEDHSLGDESSELESLGLPEAWLEDFQEELNSLRAKQSEASIERLLKFLQAPAMEMSTGELHAISERYGHISRVALSLVAHPNCSLVTLGGLFAIHHRDFSFVWQMIEKGKKRPPDIIVGRIKKDYGDYLMLKNAPLTPWWQEKLCRSVQPETLGRLVEGTERILKEFAHTRRHCLRAEIPVGAQYLHLMGDSPGLGDSSRIIVSKYPAPGSRIWRHEITYEISQEAFFRQIRIDGEHEPRAEINLDAANPAKSRQLSEVEACCVISDLERMVDRLDDRRHWSDLADCQSDAA